MLFNNNSNCEIHKTEKDRNRNKSFHVIDITIEGKHVLLYQEMYGNIETY